MRAATVSTLAAAPIRSHGHLDDLKRRLRELAEDE
jgi:hypothetical protein